MSDPQAIADRVEIDALRGEFVDAVMMHDFDRLASLFTDDGVIRMDHINVTAVGREQIRAGGERLQERWDCFVQTTHAGTIQLDGETASGRAYIFELMHGQEHGSNLAHGIYHDRYRRTRDGWKFRERSFEVVYVDTTPLRGSAPATRVGVTA